MEDLLGDIFGVLKVHASLYFRATLRPPFSIHVPADGRRIRFHIASAGYTCLSVEGGPCIRLSPGDLALVPHGSAHILADRPDTPAVPLQDVLALAKPDRVGHLSFGGEGQASVLVCGHFGYLDESGHPVLATLPKLIHIPAQGGLDYSWFELALRHMADESECALPGHAAVLARLSEVMLMQVLRAHVKYDRAATPALAALADPSMRRVLTAVHAHPAERWTVGSLAKTAFLSRTVFAERFRAHFGMPPMQYVTLWRLQRARVLLLDQDLQVKEIVRFVGFSSSSAFSRAFKTEFGEAPAVYRQRRRPRSIAN